MKYISLIAVLLGLSVFGLSVNADVVLQSKDEVQGTWRLQTTKNSLNDRRPVMREDVWDFKGDKVTITHIPREGTYYDQPPVAYDVVEGKLKVDILGGSRFDLFTVVEKGDKNMTLKGKFGDYYFFDKK
ncbi:hypothetical protein MGMO_143c00030 [Methyloglobulus morosus KoM1]|uniref:Lipocalin-like domain-containing protein n=1 Tax=Methyloglobulus morosus KoM1 TaxID=1116472 RepID=V5BRK0_9GAMM|nr:hypothetical protein [Methyloglobulus morosus]ESS68802.1 hypothetical protein MGMO_143c00030 [Methyloglobulus morosus KoM1]